MPEKYAGRAGSLSAPAMHGFSITPDNDETLAAETRAIYIGTSGDLAVTLVSGDEVTFAGVPGGTILPVRTTKVLATGTTAADLVGLY